MNLREVRIPAISIIRICSARDEQTEYYFQTHVSFTSHEKGARQTRFHPGRIIGGYLHHRHYDWHALACSAKREECGSTNCLL